MQIIDIFNKYPNWSIAELSAEFGLSKKYIREEYDKYINCTPAHLLDTETKKHIQERHIISAVPKKEKKEVEKLYRWGYSKKTIQEKTGWKRFKLDKAIKEWKLERNTRDKVLFLFAEGKTKEYTAKKLDIPLYMVNYHLANKDKRKETIVQLNYREKAYRQMLSEGKGVNELMSYVGMSSKTAYAKYKELEGC